MKKLDFIDFTKGVCMILIMLGHIFPIAGHPVMAYAYAFHVPAFYVVSGVLIAHTGEERRPLGRMVRSNLLRLLVPYLSFEALYILVYCLFHGTGRAMAMARDTLSLASAGLATWFLPALLLSKLYVLLARKYLRHPAAVAALCLIPFAIAMTIGYETALAQRWRTVVLRTCNGVGFVWLGTVLYRKLDYLTRKNWVLIVCLAVSVTAALWNGRVSVLNMHYKQPLLYLTAAVTGTLTMFALGARLPESPVIRFFANNSVIAMGTHQLLLLILYWTIGQEAVWEHWYLYLAVIMALEVPIAVFINRWAPFLLGRGKAKAV